MGTFHEQKVALANVGHLVDQGGHDQAFFAILADRLNALSLTWDTMELSEHERTVLDVAKDRLLRKIKKLGSKQSPG